MNERLINWRPQTAKRCIEFPPRKLRRKGVVERARIVGSNPCPQVADQEHDRHGGRRGDNRRQRVFAEPFRANIATDDAAQHDEVREVIGHRLEPRAELRIAYCRAGHFSIAAVEHHARKVQSAPSDAGPVMTDRECRARGNRQRETRDSDRVGGDAQAHQPVVNGIENQRMFFVNHPSPSPPLVACR